MADKVIVAVTPAQASLLLRARYAEKCRARHTLECWLSQVERDIQRRELFISKLEASGVPREQIETFVYGDFEENY